MEQLGHDPFINHFSHPHPLELCNSQTLSITTPCSACMFQSFGWIYTCKPCNFTLHISCSKMPTSITHPAHPIHPLSLLHTPAYQSGVFYCNGCGCQGQGFNYHCTRCNFDVHITCASSSLSLTHQSHPHHLSLTFHPPYPNKCFSCNICHRIGVNHWLYRCDPCRFDAHLDCATGIHRQLPHHNSFPGPNQYQQPTVGANNVNYMHSPSMGPLQTSYHQQHGAVQAMSHQMLNWAAGINATVDAMFQGSVNAMVQGFVGAAQQAGQMFVQSFMGNDGNANNGDNNGDPFGNGDGSSSTYN